MNPLRYGSKKKKKGKKKTEPRAFVQPEMDSYEMKRIQIENLRRRGIIK